MKPRDFVHLHNHTEYSVLDGLTKISDLVDYVKDLDMEAVAVTDHGTMSGLVDLYKTAKDKDIKPIFGIEPYMAARGHQDKEPDKDKQRFHITLLAMNAKGLENLMALSTIANIDGFYYKPRIDHELLEKHNEGIICLSGCAASEISEAIKSGDMERAEKLTEWYHGVFGDRFYLEMQDHGHPDAPGFWKDQEIINQGLQKIAKKYSLPLVVTCDGHYLKHEDQDAHEILLCVGTAALLSDEKRMSFKDFNLHVIDPKDLIERWGKTHPEAIRNTKVVADRCNVELELGRILIPKFPFPKAFKSEKDYLEQLVYEGAVKRYLDEKTLAKICKESKLREITTEGPDENWSEDLSQTSIISYLPENVKSRIDYELEIINNMGFAGYLLIVWDFINWGKYRGIIFGPGRGSGAGSIVAYCLRIVDIDPLQYGLLFERFLNPDRISMPDIDTDIQDDRRDEIIEYCAKKYGQKRVSNIVTFGKMMGKMAVRDVARVMNVPYAESDRIAKLLPDPVQGRHTAIPKLLESTPDLRQEYDNNPQSREVYDFATKLEGTIRSHGVHACGVVIAPDDLVKFVPLEMAQKGVVTTQYPMGQIEELGLLKMDFLGLSNLTIINNALRIIKKVYNTEIDLSTLKLDDKAAYELLSRGESTGVFQLESAGMKRYLKDLKPSTFEDIIAMVALYRPGPMQFIDSFIKRKHGKEEITYLHPGLKNALENTYGIMVYQEQFMQISKEWCGFTGGEADTLRKAVGKKKIDLMLKMKPKFIEGAIKVGGATQKMAETFWDQLEEFANYCFNKSHAACYALIAYWTAYIKAHFPDAFMAALMTSDAGNIDRLAIEIAECRRMGLTVLAPSINESYGEFAIVPNAKTIRFGLKAVKGVGSAVVDEVIADRDEKGKFADVSDFARRISATRFNKRAWEACIKTGCFDEFNARADLLFTLERIQGFAQKFQKDAATGQGDLFGLLDAAPEGVLLNEVKIEKAPTPVSQREQLAWERELMGLYVTSHPLDEFEEYFDDYATPIRELNQDFHGKNVRIGGVIDGVRTILTKNGSKMAFVKIADKTSDTEIIVFPNVYEQIGGKLLNDVVVEVSGKIDFAGRTGTIGEEGKILLDSFAVIDENVVKNFKSSGQRTTEVFRAPERRTRGRGGYNGGGYGSGGGYNAPIASPRPKKTFGSIPKSAQKFVIMLRGADDLAKSQTLAGLLGEFPGLAPCYLHIAADDGDKFIKLKQRADTDDDRLLMGVKALGVDYYFK